MRERIKNLNIKKLQDKLVLVELFQVFVYAVFT